MSASNQPSRILFQCDFDGTVTVGDVSFLLLDEFARGDWRAILEDYKSGRISVGQFNSRAFKLVNQDRHTLEAFVLENYRMRPGFLELIKECKNKNFRFVIVSNGLDFYIQTILNDLNLKQIEVCSARTVFGNEHIEAVYLDPDGKPLDDGFKETYSRHFIRMGYRIMYAGNGASDAPAARLAVRVFATDSLVSKLTQMGTSFSRFDHLHDIVEQLKQIDIS